MGNRLYSSSLWYYVNSKVSSITVRYSIVMRDSVDGVALRKAADIVAKRYPYLMRKVVVRKDSYYFEENSLPIVVLNTANPVNLCGYESNFHEIALSYYENILFFNNTHSIFDGRGRNAILHTLIYYYCKFKYNEPIDMPGVLLEDTPIDPQEYYDPFVTEIPEPVSVLPTPKLEHEVMHLAEMGHVTPGLPHVHYLRIREDQLMKLCKSSDATPNTAISLLMCHAIEKVHPNSGKSIVAGIYCDLRSALKAQKTHKCLVATLNLEYSDEMKSLDFAEQNTILRGRMSLLTDENTILHAARGLQQWSEATDNLPTVSQKSFAANEMLQSLFSNFTFAVSYSGKSDFGSCTKYISAVFPLPMAKGVQNILEISSADGWFYITYIQEWPEDVYFNAFIKEIVAHNLDFDLLFSTRCKPCKCFEE